MNEATAAGASGYIVKSNAAHDLIPGTRKSFSKQTVGGAHLPRAVPATEDGEPVSGAALSRSDCGGKTSAASDNQCADSAYVSHNL